MFASCHQRKQMAELGPVKIGEHRVCLGKQTGLDLILPDGSGIKQIEQHTICLGQDGRVL